MVEENLWYKHAIFYELYVRAFMDGNGDGHGDFLGLISKLDYLKDLGVNCIWILPTYPSPLIDDGYDVADYYGVHPDFGTLGDFKILVKEIHQRGMKIITDLVMNHTSDQHPWFKAARKSKDSPYRDYYVWSDTDSKYPLARVIFNDSLDSNWTWDETSQQYYWHRFYPQQPDLNYDNPEIHNEMIRIIDFWLDIGIDGFRADAVPYLYEREGTNCDNLPETHEFLQKVRAYMNAKYPGRVLLVEANQWPEEVLPYLGDGTNEAHMAFHFPIMPRIFMALKQSDRSSMVDILERTPEIPEECEWCIFLRNHDELTLEMVTKDEREWMWQQYAPNPRMRLNLGIRRRLAPLLDNDHRKIKLIKSMLFTLPGSPIIYYGDEIGMGDNIWLHDRNGVRTPMQWSTEENAGFSNVSKNELFNPVIDSAEYNPKKVNVAHQIADPASLYNATKRLIDMRKRFKVLSGNHLEWAQLTEDNLSIAAYWRQSAKESILAVHNLSDQSQVVNLKIPAHISGPPLEVFTNSTFPLTQDNLLKLSLSPYQYQWFHFKHDPEGGYDL